MQLDIHALDRLVLARRGATRSTNIYGDALYWFLNARGVDATWRPTLDRHSPAVVHVLNGAFLESGPCSIGLRHIGQQASIHTWRLSVATARPMADMGAKDRRMLDGLYSHLCEYRRLILQMDDCADILRRSPGPLVGYR